MREDPEGAPLGQVVKVQLRPEGGGGEKIGAVTARRDGRRRTCRTRSSPEAAVGSGHHVVEDVEGGLALGTPAHPQLLQKHRLERTTSSTTVPPGSPPPPPVVTWMEADATWPAWSKSSDTTWEKRLALLFMALELFPKASRMV